jgi:hypothetical protein
MPYEKREVLLPANLTIIILEALKCLVNIISAANFFSHNIFIIITLKNQVPSYFFLLYLVIEKGGVIWAPSIVYRGVHLTSFCSAILFNNFSRLISPIFVRMCGVVNFVSLILHTSLLALTCGTFLRNSYIIRR